MKTTTQKSKQASGRGRRKSDALTVHFELNNPHAHKVCVAGTFNEWQPDKAEMASLGGGKWEKDIRLAPGTYEYRLVVDGKWMPDPNAAHTVVNSFGERNSVLSVP
jgi:1,4-alpha-glucan branching enzyme